ncbi:DUF6270 domain-containing protein [Iodobacter ciconiae]|uniref:Uncharacterized protein n=1 Tax=Iodobacter ciconiae TaxID=2496266 RepID=A0A3S8ZV61_9NEIS|nr:DUF6270 domain-containing protein [Iodobacter ciconiae]AZN37305.1 hypothetical protein EJO50_12900 [Iodobacter ciconiae]
MLSVFIIGSCVSRDAFNDEASSFFNIETYVARTSLASALEHNHVHGIQLENIASHFQRRMVEIDINKHLEALLLSTKADIILLDAIDERFDLFLFNDGSICTVSIELLSSGFSSSASDGKIIPRKSDEFFQLWEQGWSKLINILKKREILNNLFVNKVYWSNKHEDGSNFLPNYSAERIFNANQFLERIYSRMSVDLNSEQFIVFPESMFIGAVDHLWGSSPFHYIKDIYHGIISNLLNTHASSNEKKSNLLLDLTSQRLTSSIQWYEINSSFGATIQFEADTKSEHGTSDMRALFCIDINGYKGKPLDGFVVSHIPSIGMYHYLSTGPNKTSTRCSFTLPATCSSFRIGFRSWMPENEITIDWLRLSQVQKT